MKKMLKKIKVKYSVLLVIFLFLVSCGGGGGGPNAPSTVSYNFKQGMVIPQMKLLENNPPREIYPRSTFNIVVGVENIQAYDMKNVVSQVVGIDDMFFQFYQTKNQLPLLEGRSILNPKGEKHFFEFSGQSLDLFQNAEKQNNPYFIKLSYDSTFEFSDSICINSNLYDTYDSGCKVELKKSYSGQGAPMVVSQIEEIISPFGDGGGGNVEFRIRISNNGGGKSDSIVLTGANLGNKEILCEFQGAPLDKKVAYFDSGTKSSGFFNSKKDILLICKSTITERHSYMTTLSLSFEYDYVIKKRETLNLVK